MAKLTNIKKRGNGKTLTYIKKHENSITYEHKKVWKWQNLHAQKSAETAKLTNIKKRGNGKTYIHQKAWKRKNLQT